MPKDTQFSGSRIRVGLQMQTSKPVTLSPSTLMSLQKELWLLMMVLHTENATSMGPRNVIGSIRSNPLCTQPHTEKSVPKSRLRVHLVQKGTDTLATWDRETE